MPRNGLQAGEKAFDLKAAGLKAVMDVNDGKPQGQVNKLRQYGTQSDIAGVAVSSLDADNVAVADEMRKLQKKGVQVICVDADLNRKKLRDARAFYIGTDNVLGGEALGAAAKNLLAARRVKQGGYVQFVGRTGSHNARERMDGFKKAMGAEFKEDDRMGDDFDLKKARENVRNAIINHPDLVALVGIWSYNAPAICDVVKEKNVRDRFTVVTFDAEPGAIKFMADGQIDAMVVQNPYDMGYQSVRLLKALITKDDATVKEMFPHQGSPDGDLYDTGLKVVVPGTDSPLKAEMFSDKTQFLTLEAFNHWLAENGLKGS